MEDLTVGLMSGVKCIRDINETVRPDKGLAKVLGRSSLADQSLLSDMLNAFDEHSVEKLRAGMVRANRRNSQALNDLRKRQRITIDIDMSDLPCSKRCEGATKGYTTSRKGTPVRQMTLVYVHKHQELLDIHLHSGNTHCAEPLQNIVKGLEKQYGITEAQRTKITFRIDSGYGSDHTITWLGKRGYKVLAKGTSSRRAAAVARSINPNRKWIKISSDQYALRVKKLTSITTAHQVVLVKTKSTKNKTGWSYSLLVSTMLKKTPSTLVTFYNKRQGIEKEIQQVKSVLGLKHKRKKSFYATAALALFTLMANNLLIWFKNYLPKRVHNLGLKRLICEVLAIPGTVRGNANRFAIAIEAQYRFSHVIQSLSDKQKLLPLGF
jgi:hypothetical protein